MLLLATNVRMARPQVYRARLRGMAPGQEVAVKVQRPGLASLIPLDMYILRGVAGIGKMVLKLRSDLPSILDEFASRLFEEIDYNQEANNAIRSPPDAPPHPPS